MGAMANIDIDVQDMISTVYTVATEHEIFNPDSDDALDGRAILFSRLTSLGWISPTERQAGLDAFNRGDGKPLLAILGGLQVA
jgi:hypothetical protein